MATPEPERRYQAEEEPRARPGREPRRTSSRRGWWGTLRRVQQEQTKDHLSIIAAGVAFYWLFAIVPALAGLIAIYGLVTEPEQVQQQIDAVGRILPAQAQSIIGAQAQRISEQSPDSLQLAAVLSFLVALWSAAKGVKALMESLNIVYETEETRGFVKFNAMALLMTLGAIVVAVVALSLVVALPAILGSLGLGGAVQTLISWARWPVLAVLIIIALGIVYRYAPDRGFPQWRWLNVGAVVATVLWLIASGLFSWYVANFGSYNETYGSLGAIVILLMWFFITAYVVLFGAELNAELQRQRRAGATERGYAPGGLEEPGRAY